MCFLSNGHIKLTVTTNPNTRQLIVVARKLKAVSILVNVFNNRKLKVHDAGIQR
jgi:hypothetical protein